MRDALTPIYGASYAASYAASYGASYGGVRISRSAEQERVGTRGDD